MNEIKKLARIDCNDQLLIPQARWLASFGGKLRGFTFTGRAPVWPPQTAADALVLVETATAVSIPQFICCLSGLT
jgi:hypothetical protein